MSNRSMESESEGLTGLMEITAQNVFLEPSFCYSTLSLTVGGNFLFLTIVFLQMELLQHLTGDDFDL